MVSGGSSTTGLTSDAVTFENISLAIPSGTTKTLTIKGDYAATTNTQFAQVNIPVTSTHCVFTQSNGTTANVTTAAIAGTNQYMAAAGAQFTFVSAPAPIATTQQVTSGSPATYTGQITFKVTAFGTTYGRTLYASAMAASNVGGDVALIQAYRTDTGAAVVASGVNITIARDLTTDITTDVQSGSSELVTVKETVTYTRSTADAMGGYNLRFRMVGFVGAPVGGAYEWLGTLPTAVRANSTMFDNYVTPSVYVLPTI
jgi:hypothetical protein